MDFRNVHNGLNLDDKLHDDRNPGKQRQVVMSIKASEG